MRIVNFLVCIVGLTLTISCGETKEENSSSSVLGWTFSHREQVATCSNGAYLCGRYTQGKYSIDNYCAYGRIIDNRDPDRPIREQTGRVCVKQYYVWQ